jgi:hypothetical protein
MSFWSGAPRLRGHEDTVTPTDRLATIERLPRPALTTLCDPASDPADVAKARDTLGRVLAMFDGLHRVDDGGRCGGGTAPGGCTSHLAPNAGT